MPKAVNRQKKNEKCANYHHQHSLRQETQNTHNIQNTAMLKY